MTATLTFNLPDDQYELACALAGRAMAAEVNDLQGQVRSWLKHGHDFKTPGAALEAVRDHMLDLVTLTDRLEG